MAIVIVGKVVATIVTIATTAAATIIAVATTVATIRVRSSAVLLPAL